MKRTLNIITGILLAGLLIALGGCAAGGPAASAGPGKIAYEQLVSDDITNIHLINPDGAGERTLVGDGKTWNGTPNLSPDGTRLAFATEVEGNADIYVINVDGTGLKRLTDNKAPDMMPAWSPDGKRLAFISNRIYLMPLAGGAMDEVMTGMELYIMDADGGNVQRLTEDIVDSSAYPDWSPDGKKIVFMNVTEMPTIVTVDVGQPTPKMQTVFQRANMAAWTPKWSPDGKYVYFMADNQQDKDLYRVDADGKNLVNLTEKWPNAVGDPAISPDGTQMVFASDKDNSVNLYIMDLSSKQVKALTNEPKGMMSRPSWSR